MVTKLPVHLSRRGFARALAGAAFAPLFGVARAARLATLAWEPEQSPKLNLACHYRADAHVLLLGVPLLHRQNVGGGSVLWREFGAGGATRLLEFRGYSSPERAAGLNRIGFIREMARSQDLGAECIYFGLMTSSPEDSADDARKALHSTAKDQTYSAVDGRIAEGESETRIAHFSAPAAVSGEQSDELVERAQRALATAEKITAQDPGSGSSQSFLQAMANLLLRPETGEGRYLYSGRQYRIQVTRSMDAKATTYFREKKMVAAESQVIRISGRVRRLGGGKETEFRLWVADGTERPLPLRIEYQPKSYLRLMFESVG
jgi:hypothetical protein